MSFAIHHAALLCMLSCGLKFTHNLHLGFSNRFHSAETTGLHVDSFVELGASVDSLVAKFLFNTEDLVELGQTL